MALTDTQLRNAKPRPKAYKLTDGHGLYAEVLPTGGISWRYQYYFEGEREKVVLGTYPVMTLLDAREAHINAQRLLEKGISPAADTRKTRALKKLGETVRDYSKTWIADSDVTDKWRGELTAWMKRDVWPAIGDRKLANLKREHVLALIDKIKARGSPHSALRVRNMLAQMFKDAIGRSLMDSNPAREIPANVIASPRARERVVSGAEIARLFQLLEGVRTSAQVRGAFRMLLYTLCRLGEVVNATWAEIDLDGALWVVPAARMKMRREHLVPLAPQAVALLRNLHELAYGSRFVFPSQHVDDQPFARPTMNFVLYEIERREREAGRPWEHFTPHDLRRTGSTMLHEAGFNTDWIEKALAHEQLGVRKVYNKAQYLDQRRQMLAQWATTVDGFIDGSNVVPGRFVKAA